MNLKIMQPDEVLVDEAVVSVSAEDMNGSFTLRPRHIDYTTKLVPGILAYSIANGENGSLQEKYAAVDESILVKKGQNVLVAARQAICCAELAQLEETILQEFSQRGRHERKLRSVLAHLESSMIKRFVELS